MTKQYVWKWIAFLAVLVAIAAGFSYQASETRRKLAEDQLRAAQQHAVETEQRARQAEALESLVDQAKQETRAMQAALAAQQSYVADQSSRAKRAGGLVNGLQLASSVRVQVAEFYTQEGRWPRNNHELGLGEARSFRTGALRELNVLPEGRVELLFEGESGADERLVLIAKAVAGHAITWQCYSPDIDKISEMISTCGNTSPK